MGMNKLSPAKRAQIVAALVEGNSIRATCRMTDTAKGTVLKLLVDLGRACEGYQRQTLVNLKPRLIQCDEIWSFVGCKQKNVPEEKRDLEFPRKVLQHLPSNQFRDDLHFENAKRRLL